MPLVGIEQFVQRFFGISAGDPLTAEAAHLSHKSAVFVVDVEVGQGETSRLFL
jgi:hypothetical protein